MKVRSLTDPTAELLPIPYTVTSPASRPAWSSPPRPWTDRLKFSDFDYLFPRPDPVGVRIDRVGLNGVGVVGYSAALRGPDVLTLRAHSKGEDLSFYADFALHDIIWLYLPVAPEERISEIRVLAKDALLVTDFAGFVVRLPTRKVESPLPVPY